MKDLRETMDYIYYRNMGLSVRQIAIKFGCDPRTVKRYLDNPELINQPRKSSVRPSILDPFMDHIRQLLDREPNYKATAIYDQLCKHGYTGSYDLVKRAVKPIKSEITRLAYIRFETDPGQQAQVDFGEFSADLPDGKTIKFYVFMMVLGYSRKKYVQILTRCDMVSFLEAHVNAFEAFGGVPKEILYDRMRNVFIRKSGGKSIFTQSLVDLSLHYGFTPHVAPAYAPWVKGKVERPYGFIREGFWRGYAFSNLLQANADMRAWIEEKETHIHSTTNERTDERFVREVPFLTPLPPHPCDISQRLYRTVAKDCTIRVEGNAYVVPHTLVQKDVTVRCRHNILRVFHKDELVVIYNMPEEKGKLIQHPSFYAALRADIALMNRKFSHPQKGKGRATISPNLSKYDIEVEQRSLAEYTKICEVETYA